MSTAERLKEVMLRNGLEREIKSGNQHLSRSRSPTMQCTGIVDNLFSEIQSLLAAPH